MKTNWLVIKQLLLTKACHSATILCFGIALLSIPSLAFSYRSESQAMQDNEACEQVFWKYANNSALDLNGRSYTKRIIHIHNNKEFLLLHFESTETSEKLIFYVDCEAEKVFDHEPTAEEAGVPESKLEFALQNKMAQASADERIQIIIYFEPAEKNRDLGDYDLEIISVYENLNMVSARATVAQINQLAADARIVHIGYNAPTVLATISRTTPAFLALLVGLGGFCILLYFFLRYKKGMQK